METNQAKGMSASASGGIIMYRNRLLIAAGLYFYAMQAGGFRQVKKVMLLK